MVQIIRRWSYRAAVKMKSDLFIYAEISDVWLRVHRNSVWISDVWLTVRRNSVWISDVWLTVRRNSVWISDVWLTVHRNSVWISDVWLTVHRNSMWIRKKIDVIFVFFISLLIVAQHVSGSHVPIVRS